MSRALNSVEHRCSTARMRTLLALLTAAVVGAALLLTLPAGPANAAAVRIMPLGDSITGCPGCWRALLWNRCRTTGYTNIDFVGTLPPQGCGGRRTTATTRATAAPWPPTSPTRTSCPAGWRRPAPTSC